jgi:CheY-like chemotaxis protein
VLATGSVLYVEDDPAHRELVAEVLRARPGIRLCTCGGGGEALDALRADPPDLLLLDLDLPDLPGEAVLAAVAADPKLSGVPVCVLSGRLPDTRGVPEPAARLTKPLVPGDLLGVLDELLAPGDRTAR